MERMEAGELGEDFYGVRAMSITRFGSNFDEQLFLYLTSQYNVGGT